MVDWKSDEELSLDFGVLINVVHVFLGVYAWEFLSTIDFEWDLISGKKKLTWPLCFYFASRYSMLITLVLTAVALDMRNHNPGCQAMYTIIDVSAFVAMSTASASLALRTIALWSLNKYVVYLLSVMPVLYIGLGLRLGLASKAVWIQGMGCVTNITNTTLLAFIMGSIMIFDLIILLLNLWKLPWKALPGVERGPITSALFRDGLGYFVVAFTSNLIATVFILLRLNVVMTVIFDVPATTLSTIVACRAVRRLHDVLANKQVWSKNGHSNTIGHISTLRFTSAPRSNSAIQIQMTSISPYGETPIKPEELHYCAV